MLRDVVFHRVGHRVLIRPPVDSRWMASEIIVRRRRRNRPLERSGVPRVYLRLLTPLHAPEKVVQEDQLPGHGDERGYRDEEVNTLQWPAEGKVLSRRIAPRMAHHAQEG